MVLLLLGGCTHLPDVQEMGHGQLSLRASAGSGGYYGSHEASVEAADAYCGARGQQAEIDGFYDHSALGPNGEHESSVIFSCTRRAPLHF
ncbi:MAG: hypothetical protein JOZ67_09125 [Gammaproteobacteria bacterium]|nr:hypothetical protein [Gammaproteobacteria bacterium]MBV9697403.1 hypothetical protein [Gammaproteobacteria bacterium]